MASAAVLTAGPPDALVAAARGLGVTVIGPTLRSLGDDLREGVRRVRRKPRLTLLAAGTLALGVGAGTAVFTIAHSILFEPAPFRDPDRLVSLRGRTPGWQMGVSAADLADYREVPGLFDAAALTSYAEFTWTDRSLPGFDSSEVFRGLVVTDEYFRVFARPMAAGRGFTEDDRRRGRDAVVISHSLWVQRFDSRPDVIGTTMTLNGRAHTVVGVAGPGLLTYEQYDVQAWTTFQPSSDRRAHQYDCYGRLGPGVSMEQAQRRLDAVSARLAGAFPESDRDYSVSVSPLLEDLHEQARPAFVALAGAVACLLLIAVANVASVLLARATVEAREMAIRSALGAGRLRLVRMMIAESDGPGAEPIAIVNDSLAERFWPGQNPVGRMIKSGGGPWRRVVGVVRRIRHGGPEDEYRNEIYMPFRQFNQDTMFLVVRSALPPESIVPSIRSALRAIDPDVPAFEIRTLDQAFVRQIAGPRLLIVLTTGSAAVAATLAALGLFGVMAYWVSQRVKELGVRAALGARPRELHAVVLLQGGRLMVVGLLSGVAGSLAAMRLLRSLLYGVSDRDASVYAGAISLSVVTTVAACWLPARRAARTDPVDALREEG